MSNDPSSYFIDESGHGGDLASAQDLEFSKQPVFALACVGAFDPEGLSAELERLRLKHRCGPGELKSTMARLPQFVTDLASYLDNQDCPIFIELVDKRFFVAIHIVNHLLCSGLGAADVPFPTRNAIAEFLAGAEQILLSYIAVCRDPSISSIRQILQELWDWLDESDEEIARDSQFLLFDARDKAARSSANAHEFLPIFDLTDRDQKVWMLPNLQSLTNIYARINHSRSKPLSTASLIHDEQLQYGRVLIDAKQQMEKLADLDALPFLPFADYKLIGRAEMRFTTTAAEPCLQAADILAGCAMRFARDAMKPKRRVNPALRAAFFDLLGLSDASRGVGINLVFTYRDLARMEVPTF